MTGYTVHTGSNENYSQGWDAIFRKGAGSAKKKSAAKETDKSPKKGVAKNAAKRAGKKK